MANKTKAVTTQEDLAKFAKSCLRNLKEFDGYTIEYNSDLFNFTLKLKGEKYNSSITTPVMDYLLSIQKGIYVLYRQYTSRRPTKAEKKQLEMVVRVEKGSSGIFFSLLDQFEVIKEAVKNMTGDQTFAAIIIGISAFTVSSISKRIFDHLEKKHAQDIKLQKNKAQNDKDKMIIEAFSETVAVISDVRKNAITSLSKIDDETVLSYSGEDLPLQDLKERIAAERKRSEPEMATVQGSYRITRLHLNFETNSAKADMYETKTGEVLTSVDIQPRSIIDGTFKVLKRAQNKQDVDLQIIVQHKGDKITKATLDKIL